MLARKWRIPTDDEWKELVENGNGDIVKSRSFSYRYYGYAIRPVSE